MVSGLRKKMLRSFTFWFMVAGVVVVTYNFVGQDDKNIIMIGLNPILSRLSHSDYRPLINSILYLWHLLSISSMILYGAFFDAVICFYHKRKRRISK